MKTKLLYAAVGLVIGLALGSFLYVALMPAQKQEPVQVQAPVRGQGISNIIVEGPRVLREPTPVLKSTPITSSSVYKADVNEVQVTVSHPTLSDTVTTKTDYQISFDGTNFYSYQYYSQTLAAGSSYLISYTFPSIGLFGRVVITPQTADKDGTITPTIKAWLFKGR